MPVAQPVADQGAADSAKPFHGLASCSVVVSTRDRPGSLQACLESVRAQGAVVLETIVVDSAPAHAPAEVVAVRLGARYARLEKPGLSRARNYGARLAQGDIVVFLDDDLTLEPGCLVALMAEFADAAVVAAGGRITMVGGNDEAREAFESLGGFDPGSDRRVVDHETEAWFELVNFGGMGSGAMLAVRRATFSRWSGFDERLGRGAAMDAGEENRAYFALVELGYRVVYTPEAVARHPGPASLGELRRRLLDGAVTGAAYLVLLFVEHPAYRAAVLRYVGQALRGRPREWRPRRAGSHVAVASRWRVGLAWLRGPWVYARMRLRARHGDRTVLFPPFGGRSSE